MPKVGQKEIRRKQIIKSVLKIIAEKGIHNLTLEMVENRAGVSKGIVSYYFSSKDELILQSYKALIDSSIIDVLGDIDLPVNLDSIEIMIEKIFSEFKYDGLVFTNEEIEKIFLQFYMKSSFDKRFEEYSISLYNDYIEKTKLVIDYGIKNNDFKNVNSTETAYMIYALMDGLLLYNLIRFNPSNTKPKELVVSFIKDLLIKE